LSIILRPCSNIREEECPPEFFVEKQGKLSSRIPAKDRSKKGAAGHPHQELHGQDFSQPLYCLIQTFEPSVQALKSALH
jgi:hypothetical protein